MDTIQELDESLENDEQHNDQQHNDENSRFNYSRGSTPSSSEGPAPKRRRLDVRAQFENTLTSLSKNFVSDSTGKFFEYMASKVRESTLSADERSQLEIEVTSVVMRHISGRGK